jgi:hypothetical protein
MEYVTEDPTYLAAGLGVLALIFLVMLKVTQQGKYLLYAGAVLGVLVFLLAVERMWVTDNERIEDVVYGLAKAVGESDGDKAAEFLAEDCMMEPSGDRSDLLMRAVSSRFAGPLPPQRLREALPNFKFDYLRITRLQAHAGALSGMGTAEFAVHTMGQQTEPFATYATPPAGMGWSFGLREVSPHVWKVVRISPGRRERL